MTEKFQLHTVQNLIGYNFKNPSLLAAAFTHTSVSRRLDDSNEGLIFLGRAVCELLIRDYLYSNFMKLETVRLSVSDSEARVAPLMKKCCENSSLTEYMLLSDNATALRHSRTVEQDLFCALVGAIYKDGGMPSARAFMLPKLRGVISDEAPDLMREAKKDIIRKSGNERDIFSDHGGTKEKRSATSALKSLFSSKKKKAEMNNPSKSETVIAPVSIEDNTVKPTPAPAQSVSADVRTTEQRNERTQQKSHAPKHMTNDENAQSKAPSDGNYKSALQEYVQKNIRSATVMLEYKDSRVNGGCETEIYLFGKKIAGAAGSSKKEASQLAAKEAYNAIMLERGEASEWFKKLKADPETAIQNTAHSTETDFISQLNQTYQKKLRRSNATLKYESIPAKNKKLIAFAVIANGERLGVGEGKNAKEAKQNAARSSLMMLGKL